MLRRILMRLRGVRILMPEGTLMCRTHTTQHELSAIAPNCQWEQLHASLGLRARAHTRGYATTARFGGESSPASPFATTGEQRTRHDPGRGLRADLRSGRMWQRALAGSDLQQPAPMPRRAQGPARQGRSVHRHHDPSYPDRRFGPGPPGTPSRSLSGPTLPTTGNCSGGLQRPMPA